MLQVGCIENQDPARLSALLQCKHWPMLLCRCMLSMRGPAPTNQYDACEACMRPAALWGVQWRVQ